MIKKFIGLVTAITTMGAGALLAQQGTTSTGEGTLRLETKTYTFKHAIAYETTVDNEDAISVVLSGQAIASEKLKEARAKEKEGGDSDFNRPFLRLVFKKTGELKYWSAAAGGTMLGRHTANATGELKVENGRAMGKANQPMESEGMFPSGLEAQFDVPLLKAGDSPPESTARKGGPAANVKPSVTGLFKGNGKEAKLAYVSAQWGEPFSGRAGIVLVFSEKDHSKNKKPDFDASFGKFGNALIISLHEDGQIYGCQVVHSAHKRQGFSSIGQLESNDFSYADGKVEGELATNGQVEVFGETWEVKIKFVAPLGEIPKELQPPESKKEAKEEKPTSPKSDDEDDDDNGSATKSTGAEFKAKDLALTKDASEVEYKSIVGQLAFKSKSNVKSVCAELAVNLKAQGWTNDGRDMIQPASSIMKRKRGAATLTIFVKPADAGSEVKMMTEGLSWEGL